MSQYVFLSFPTAFGYDQIHSRHDTIYTRDDLQDEQEVEKVLREDWEAVELLLRKYRQTVYIIIFSLLQSKEAAGRVFIDTIVSAFRDLDVSKPPERLDLWVYRRAIHNARIAWRVALIRKARSFLKGGDAGRVAPRSATKERGEAVTNGIPRPVFWETLGDMERELAEVIVLHSIGELTLEDMGQVLGVPGETVDQRIREASRMGDPHTWRERLTEAMSGTDDMGELSGMIMERIRTMPRSSTVHSDRPSIKWRPAWTTVLAAVGIVIIALGAIAELAPREWILLNRSPSGPASDVISPGSRQVIVHSNDLRYAREVVQRTIKASGGRVIIMNSDVDSDSLDEKMSIHIPREKADSFIRAVKRADGLSVTTAYSEESDFEGNGSMIDLEIRFVPQPAD